ncbi:PREDICTED: uncharacterized protein LOC100637799 isoform X2 [Amphimedon queenslandica]|uniref:Ig-like domain-containing protein n=1 Tax=Amphimedon queenslandica TaxID=400682 RepID=A0AAN0JBB0_AMPQE|nr:PREDICTED: uncharacterized protein LOC100637799 isoform X2 [Amphimedon queenslandica]|eukprot:XP_019854067.1 PREDICTED: uncharacterized protein LOC100637799 isoform X2 [Amphimedon queenslandica]
MAAMTKLLLLSFLIESSLQTFEIEIAGSQVSTPSTVKVKDPYIFCGYESIISDGCKLHDGVTNEGLAFNSDHFVEWKRPFRIKFLSGFTRPVPINDFLTRIDVYYYSNASLGYGLCGVSSLKVFTSDPHVDPTHLTFINNYKVSQSDNGTRMLSMIILNSKPLIEGIYFFDLRFSLSSSDLATKTSISEIRLFSDKEPIPFSAVPIIFKSPNETLQLDTVQSSLNLSCTVVNNGTFNWTWTGPGVNNGVIKVADTTRTSILMLSSISAANAGNYTCSASYLAMGESAWGTIEPNTNSKTINLIIYSSVSTPANTVIIEEGNDATLSCLFTGYLPINYKITWSGLIPSNVIIANYENIKFRTQHGGPSTSPAVQSIFKIKSAKVADSGLYTCSMSGTTLRETILLMVVTQKTSWQVELE